MHNDATDARSPEARVEENLPITTNHRPPPIDRDPIMQFFAAGHLPERLRTVSLPFCELAEQMFNTLPRNPERTVALRKLLEAKDAAVRAVVAS
jgi:hypothetical protein